MLCEADEKMENVIFYMNRTAIEVMHLNHERLNPSLRGADVRAAMGRSIHLFHKDPEYIRNVFRSLGADKTKEHKTELVLGGVAFTWASPRSAIRKATSWPSTPPGAISAMRNSPNK